MVLCAECRVSWDTEFGPLVTGYSATCGNDDSKPCFICCSAREVGNFAEVGFSDPGLDYCLEGGGGGSKFGFLFWQILYVGPAAVAVVRCAGVSEGNRVRFTKFKVLFNLL